MNKSYNRDFGLLISAVILFFFIRSYYLHSIINYYLIGAFFFFITVAILRPRWLSVFSILWFYFGILLSKIVSPLILFIIFYFLITPVALIFKILKKDLLKTNFLRNQSSNWVDRNEQPKSMKKQF
jgi:hypothetical protein